MEFKRETNPMIAEWLIPWYIPGDEDQFQIAKGVRDKLTNDLDNTFVCIAHEDGIGHGILIAYVHKKSVWVWQARVRNGFKYSREFWEELIKWAKSKKVKDVRCGSPSPQVRKLLQRRYKFEERGNELVRQIA